MALALPLVDVDTLSAFMRAPFSTAEEEQAYLILQVVSAWARTVGGKNWNNTTTPPPDDVVGVVLSAARREMTNPNRVISESLGPVSVTWAPPPDDFFTPAELRILSRKSKGSLFTVSTRREDAAWAVGYLHMREDLSDEPIPYLNYGEPGFEGTIPG
jgi:hypothetical protein